MVHHHVALNCVVMCSVVLKYTTSFLLTSYHFSCYQCRVKLFYNTSCDSSVGYSAMCIIHNPRTTPYCMHTVNMNEPLLYVVILAIHDYIILINNKTPTSHQISDFLIFCFTFFFFSFLFLSCHVLSCLVLSCLVLSCLVLSCHVLSCLVLFCLVLSSLVWVG